MFNLFRKPTAEEQAIALAQGVSRDIKKALAAIRTGKNFDARAKADFVEWISVALVLQTGTAIKPMEDEQGHVNREALGYVFGFIDTALRKVGQDMADLSVAVPITHQILRKLWPNQAEKYTKYLYKDGSDDLTLMVGIMRGGQQVFDWLVPESTMAPMGLAMYLSQADIAKSA